MSTALTHASWINEYHDQVSHNERLEFLGDAVLELAVTQYLFTTFLDCREGELTRFRSGLVNEAMLARLAKEAGIDKALHLGKGEETQGGRQRASLLADAFEAVLGAIYLDGGFDAAQAFIQTLYAPYWPTKSKYRQHKDYKTQLQELTQKLYKALPVYTLAQSQGPEHAKSFKIIVTLPNNNVFCGKGSSLRRAEHNAAKKALENWKDKT